LIYLIASRFDEQGGTIFEGLLCRGLQHPQVSGTYRGESPALANFLRDGRMKIRRIIQDGHKS